MLMSQLFLIIREDFQIVVGQHVRGEVSITDKRRIDPQEIIQVSWHIFIDSVYDDLIQHCKGKTKNV